MKSKLFLMLFLMTVYGQQPVEANDTSMGNNSIVSDIFARPVPDDYQLLQSGELPKQEGNGEFLILASTRSNTKMVILALDQLSWIKTREIESANAVKVGKQIVRRFFPDLGPVSITEDKQENSSSQYAPHLRMTTVQGVTKTAIALRLLYPKNKAYILLLWQPTSVQNFSLAYQQLEDQAKIIIRELKEPSTIDTQFSERYILWRLRHIFKKGVYTHLIESNENK